MNLSELQLPQIPNGVAGFLQINAQMQKQCNSGVSSCQFIIDHGVRGRTTPKSFPRWGQMKECFKNALEAAVLRDLIYCEGYALGAVIPVLHAWCIDADGNIIDPTWESGDDYVGVPFKTGYVLRFTNRHGVYDSVVENYRDRWPLLLGKIPLSTALHPNLDIIRRRLNHET